MGEDTTGRGGAAEWVDVWPRTNDKPVSASAAATPDAEHRGNNPNEGGVNGKMAASSPASKTHLSGHCPPHPPRPPPPPTVTARCYMSVPIRA